MYFIRVKLQTLEADFMLLVLSLISIIIGPIILNRFPKSRRLDNFLFSLVLVSVGGILLLETLPTLWKNIRYWLIPLVLIGFIGPGLIEKSFHNKADKTHKITLTLGLSGLLLHAAIDGFAIVQHSHQIYLPYAIILHRLIVGLSIWWLVEPIWGKMKTYWVFFGLLLTTTIGYYLGSNTSEHQPFHLNYKALDYFQAIVAGMLMHVIIHRPHIDDDGHQHDHEHALQHDPEHKHSHGIVIKHPKYFASGIVVALVILFLLHELH